MDKKIIEIWSSYPPPFGGVSIHSLRLFHNLKRCKEFDLLFKNFSVESADVEEKGVVTAKNAILELIKLLFSSKKYIHFHSNNWYFWCLVGLFPFNVKFVITIHNIRLYQLKNPFYLFAIKRFFKKAHSIFVNSNSFKTFLSEKFLIEESKIEEIEAFIPPLLMERSEIPQEVAEFRRNVTYLISGNAYMLYRDKNGEDVYGLDLLVRLVYEMRKEGFDLGMVFCLPKISDIEYWNDLKKQIKEMNITSHILILNRPIVNAFQIWEISDLFIRPTNTDIEAISVKEALSFGTRCIASDVCERPSSVIKFRTRDFNDLKEKVTFVLKEKPKTNVYNSDKSLDKIKYIYSKLIS